MDRDIFIDFMVRSGVIKFGSFMTKSGRMSPYFINMGSYCTGEQMQQLGRFYAGFIRELQSDGRLPDRGFAIFGPAYKGIPLAVAASVSLMADFGLNTFWCFNRKEKKDHGEGGSMVGYELKDGDEVLIVDDVVTAGTAVRESLKILKAQADVNVIGIVVAVDRMERGTGDRSALDEISGEHGIDVFPMVNVREIVDSLHGRSVDGNVLIDDDIRSTIEEHLDRYGASR